MVSCRSLPATYSFSPSFICTWPRLLTTTCRWPLTPISVSLYCSSIPVCPTMSSGEHLENSGMSSWLSVIWAV